MLCVIKEFYRLYPAITTILCTCATIIFIGTSGAHPFWLLLGFIPSILAILYEYGYLTDGMNAYDMYMNNDKCEVLNGILYGCEVRINDHPHNVHELIHMHNEAGSRYVYIEEVKHYKTMQNAIRYAGRFIDPDLHDKSEWHDLLSEEYDTDIDQLISQHGVQMIHWACRATTW